MNEEYKYIKSAALKKLVKDINGDIRVGKAALERLRVVYEDTLRGHTGLIMGLTLGAGRKTITVEDIEEYLKTADN